MEVESLDSIVDRIKISVLAAGSNLTHHYLTERFRWTQYQPLMGAQDDLLKIPQSFQYHGATI